VTWQKLKNQYHFLQAFLAALYFRFPGKKLTIIGITGTDGKTTTANMIYHILKVSGHRVSITSSIGAQIRDKSKDTGFHVTTPSPFQVQKLLNEAAKAKSEYFVLEATSHGLEQNRLAFINFKVGVATNITSDHMDYHKTWEKYAIAKAKLFKRVDFSILNADDKSYAYLKDKVSGKIITYTLHKGGDFNLSKYSLKSIFTQSYNRSNALAASATASVIGIPKEKIIMALRTFTGVSGRIQQINAGQNFRAIIDFAHTPNAFENVLSELKKQMSAKAKLISVFGSAGGRDKSKRPLMGEIAARFSDISVITSEDPRNENVMSIIEDIAKGFKKLRKQKDLDYFEIPKRRDAISFAVNLAKAGDTIIFLGKGHEKSMTIGKKDFPWDEPREVKKAIKRRFKNGK